MSRLGTPYASKFRTVRHLHRTLAANDTKAAT